jgi:hypothetical protein
MRLLEYILKFGFMYGVSIGLLLVLAPLMWKSAGEATPRLIPNTHLQQLKLFVKNPQSFGEERYLDLQVIDASGQQYGTIFFLPDRDHRELLKVLNDHKLIGTPHTIMAELPVVLTYQNHQELLSDVYLDVKENRINQLQLGGQMVIGNSGYGRQAFLYLLSVVFGVGGILALALTTYALAGNLRQYNQSGRLPDLPNSVQSKWEGLKFLLKGFKN